MSSVTDVLLLGGVGEVRHLLGEIDAWTVEHAGGQRLVSIDERGHGGDKAFQSDCFAAAVNHLDAEAFTAFLRGLPWMEGAEVQLCLKGEHDPRFTLLTICGGAGERPA